MMTKTDIAKLLQSLRSIALFNSLSDEELTAILNAPENGIEDRKPKELIVRESELGECMYVITEGTVEVTIRSESGGREVTINTLHAGDFFGEQALLPGSSGRRNASVRALLPSRVFRIDKKYVLLNVQRDIAQQVDSEAVTEVSDQFKAEDKAAEAGSTGGDASIQELLAGMRLFRSLSPQELSAYHNWTDTIEVGPGEFVIKEDQAGEHLYVVIDGTVEIFLLDTDGKINIVAEHKRGNYFGEQALLPGSDGKRNAYARMDKRGQLLKVPKEYFRLILNRDTKLAETLSKVGQLQKDINTKISKS
ncbi:MAG: cyclic nucleotide-binding domain-containing protein [Gammaproteobacteria bacterium]